MSTKAERERKAEEAARDAEFEAEMERQERISGENLGNYYPSWAPGLRLNSQEFRFKLIRDGKSLGIGSLVRSVEWADEGSEFSVNRVSPMKGTVVLSKAPADQVGAQILVEEGHLIRCDVRWGGRWEHLWEMRISKPVLQLEDGGWTFELADDLQQAALSRDTWSYKAPPKKKKKAKRRNGWRYDEIVRDVCSDYKIPLGAVVKGRRRIKDFKEVKVTPLEAIRKAVEAESLWTGRRLVIRWEWRKNKSGNGGKYALTITEPKRNPFLYAFRNQITSATIETIRHAEVATALTVKGKGEKPKPAKENRLKNRRRKERKVTPEKRETFKRTYLANGKKGMPNAMDTLGYIHKDYTVTEPVDSYGELKKHAKRRFTVILNPKHKIEMSHPGIAFIRRGDGLQLKLPEEGLKGKKGIVFVAGVRHSLAGDSYTMSLTLTFLDPLDPDKLRKERDDAKKYRAALRRKAREARERAARRAAGGSGPGGQTGARPGYPTSETTSVGGQHETAGLPGYPAYDYFAPAGSPAVSPVDGVVTKISGQDPSSGGTPGGAHGYSVYIAGGGKKYYLTHMGTRSVNPNDRLRQGQKVGTVASWAGVGGTPHIHMGVQG